MTLGLGYHQCIKCAELPIPHDWRYCDSCLKLMFPASESNANPNPRLPSGLMAPVVLFSWDTESKKEKK